MTPEKATQLLFKAAQGGNLTQVKAALDAGADLKTASTALQWTPLHAAAYYGHTDLAHLLIEKGADPNASDALQRTPLHYAAANGHADPARLLIEKGADPTARDEQQRTPLQYAVRYRRRTDLVTMLQDAARDKPGHAARVAKGRGNDEPQIG